MSERELTYTAAIREAFEIELDRDPSVYLIGEGVPDPRGIFGTTTGLADRFGTDRVLDMPLAENGMTGVAVGSALTGARPVLMHQRLDFALLSMDQLINNAAKWHYMFNGQHTVPLVVRMVVGRGWGQGPQHSQSLQAWFAHIPGLKVVMPSTPRDAKGLMLAAIEDDNPVVFIEHRWLHNITGLVPEGHYTTPIGEARMARRGTDVTLVASSHASLECLRAAEILADNEIDAEVIDLRAVRPLDVDALVSSVARTRAIVAVDDAWRTCGVAGEVVAEVCERSFHSLASAPMRVTLPDHPTPTSPALAASYYPQAADIAEAVARVLDRPLRTANGRGDSRIALDVPDPTFTGPF